VSPLGGCISRICRCVCLAFGTGDVLICWFGRGIPNIAFGRALVLRFFREIGLDCTLLCRSFNSICIGGGLFRFEFSSLFSFDLLNTFFVASLFSFK